MSGLLRAAQAHLPSLSVVFRQTRRACKSPVPRARSQRSHFTLMMHQHHSSGAISTFTPLTFSASKFWQVHRARSSGQAQWVAQSAISPISLTQVRSAQALTPAMPLPRVVKKASLATHLSTSPSCRISWPFVQSFIPTVRVAISTILRAPFRCRSTAMWASLANCQRVIPCLLCAQSSHVRRLRPLQFRIVLEASIMRQSVRLLTMTLLSKTIIMTQPIAAAVLR